MTMAPAKRRASCTIHPDPALDALKVMDAAKGFTLVEVLVALVIAAILASGLLAMQQYGLNQAGRADVLWLHLNTAQEALMGRNIGLETSSLVSSNGLASSVTPPFGQAPSSAWITTSPPSAERPSPWLTLTTRVQGQETKWSWPLASP
ncbi:type II secretion system protein [Desulfonatronum thioautotrophicum]|uniref:type II secretion system protein n=1 Tax=Desulfonatronum thioautotrophicum TaxID=617001 RepID=UPI0005EBE902|nr:type II secretion system protein [Desulfonatronum thioautotrophicum]